MPVLNIVIMNATDIKREAALRSRCYSWRTHETVVTKSEDAYGMILMTGALRLGVRWGAYSTIERHS